jgi:hypothetical protein
MSDTPEPADAQAADAAPAQAAIPTEPAQAAETDEIKKLRREAASYRTRLKELEAAEEQRQQAQLTEQERLAKTAQKLQADLEAATSALRQERGRAAVTTAAAKLGAPVDLVAKLVTVEFDADGRPVGVEQAVAAILKEHPQLVAAPAAALGNGARSQAQQETAADRRAARQAAGKNFLDPDVARAAGGGVFFKE